LVVCAKYLSLCKIYHLKTKKTMSHEINYNEEKGTYSFVSNTQTPWHGLGQIVKGAMTSEEVIEKANLGYEVQKTEVFAGIQTPSGLIYSPYESKFATYRTDTNDVLGLVGSRYEIVQNKDAFGFFDAIVDKGEAIFETAGVLGKGERIFITAKLPEDMLVNGEKCEKYIILTNSHNGSSCIIAGFTTVRIVCKNTLVASLQGLENKVAIKHNTGAREKLNEAHKVMNIASKYMDELSDVFNKMSDTAITDEMLKKYITDVMKPSYIATNDADNEILSTRLKNQVESIYDFAKTHPTQITPASNGTVWGAYNSISGYFNYVKSYKDDKQKNESQLFGSANQKILTGFEKAIELI